MAGDKDRRRGPVSASGVREPLPDLPAHARWCRDGGRDGRERGRQETQAQGPRGSSRGSGSVSQGRGAEWAGQAGVGGRTEAITR